MNIDYIHFAINIFVVFLISKYVRLYFETKTRNIQIDEYLKFAWLGAAILYFLLSISLSKYVDKVFYYAVFAFILFCTYRFNDPKITRTVLTAILPIFLFSVIKNFLETFFPKLNELYGGNVGLFSSFSLFWLIGFSIYS